MAPPTHGGTFQPLQHKSGALRDRLHSYTKSTLGAGGSINEAVRFVFHFCCVATTMSTTTGHFFILFMIISFMHRVHSAVYLFSTCRSLYRMENHVRLG
jgi:hypothetical protein